MYRKQVRRKSIFGIDPFACNMSYDKNPMRLVLVIV